MITINREQSAKERKYITEIGDLDNYSEDYMVEQLTTLGSSSPLAKHKAQMKKGYIDIQHSLIKMKLLAEETRKKAAAAAASQRSRRQTSYEKSQGQSSSELSRKNTSGSSFFSHSNLHARAQNITNFLISSPKNITEPYKQPVTTTAAMMFNINDESAINKSTVRSLHSPRESTANLTKKSITNNDLSSPQSATFNSNSSSSFLKSNIKLRKANKLEAQKQGGYHIIKRNQSEHLQIQVHYDELHSGKNKKKIPDRNNADLLHEESDDASNASHTEATLDALYRESIAIKKRLTSSDNQDGLIRKLKQMIKLDQLKKNVIQANHYKLDHK